jgi:hypothetical protein
MKCQVRTALDQAGKSYGLMKHISVLEDKVSSLVAQVMHLKESDSFLVDFIESACEQLKCKFPADLLEFFAASFIFCILMSLRLPGEGFRSIVNQKYSYGCEQESQDRI